MFCMIGSPSISVITLLLLFSVATLKFAFRAETIYEVNNNTLIYIALLSYYSRLRLIRHLDNLALCRVATLGLK